MPYVGGGRGYTFDRRYLYNTSSKEDRPVRQVSIADRTHVPNFSVVTVIPGRTRKEQEEERETQRTRDLFQATRLPVLYFFYQIPRPKSDQHKPPIHPIPPLRKPGHDGSKIVRASERLQFAWTPDERPLSPCQLCSFLFRCAALSIALIQPKWNITETRS